MKTVLVALCLSLVAVEAQAISRYNSTSMSCGEVKAIINDEGAAIMRWRSKRGNPLYGRFVVHQGFCSSSERAERSYIRSADRESCPVLECKPFSIEDDDLFLWRRRWD